MFFNSWNQIGLKVSSGKQFSRPHFASGIWLGDMVIRVIHTMWPVYGWGYQNTMLGQRGGSGGSSFRYVVKIL